MPNLDEYRHSYLLHTDKEYVGNGVYKYVVTKTYYNFGQLVDTEVYEFETDSPSAAAEDGIVGLIESRYPEYYNLVTSISELGITSDGGKFSLALGSNKGLTHVCANCSALLTVNVANDFTTPLGGNYYDNEYAFFNCSSLTQVTLGDILDVNSNKICIKMFQGCEELTTVIGTINISEDSLIMYEDMFKNCSNVNGLVFKDSNNLLLADPEIQGFNGVGYQYLGLTSTDQFTITS